MHCPCIESADAHILQRIERSLDQPFIIYEMKIEGAFEKYNSNTRYGALMSATDKGNEAAVSTIVLSGHITPPVEADGSRRSRGM